MRARPAAALPGMGYPRRPRTDAHARDRPCLLAASYTRHSATPGISGPSRSVAFPMFQELSVEAQSYSPAYEALEAAAFVLAGMTIECTEIDDDSWARSMDSLGRRP